MLANRQTACLMHANSPGFTTDTMNNSVERREKKGGGGGGKAPSTLPSRFQTSAEKTRIKSMPQLSPFHPSLRKYSAKRPVRHHRFRQCCLSEIFDSYFCWLLISPPPPSPLYRLFYFFCLGAGTCPRDGILLHIPFSLLSRERGGRGLQGRNSLCSPPPQPPVRLSVPPQYFHFSHGQITWGLECYHPPYFTWRRYLEPLKIYFY